MSAIGGKADVRDLPAVCPLIAKSGHSGRPLIDAHGHVSTVNNGQSPAMPLSL